MASYAVLTALSGFTFDMCGNKKVGFSPRIHQDDFSCFFSTGLCWGVYTQKKNKSGALERNIEILYGDKSVQLV